METESCPSISLMSTDTVPPSSENFMALSRRFIHTCFKSSAFAEIVYSENFKSILRFFSLHFSARRRTAALISSERLNSVISLNIVWFSMRERLRTFDAITESLRDSSSMTVRYSSLSSGVRFPRLRSLAKPEIEAIGVLNSWEKLLMKSLRSISVCASSSAALLKLVSISWKIGWEFIGLPKWSLALKSPLPSRFSWIISLLNGLRGILPMEFERMNPITMLEKKMNIVTSITPILPSVTAKTPSFARRKRMRYVMSMAIPFMPKTISDRRSASSSLEFRSFFVIRS